VTRLERKLGITNAAVEGSVTLAAKRFRIAVKVLGLSLAGVPVVFDVQWSSPMPTAVYNVDVACSALLGMPTVVVTNQTKSGCTITFTPSAVVTNATVIALGISPAA
jgi:hypothetical protein